MKLIITKNKANNKILPMVNLFDEEKEKEVKKTIKKQLIDQIINEPQALKAYKELQIIKIGNLNLENGKLEPEKEEIIIDYETVFNELIEDLTKEEE